MKIAVTGSSGFLGSHVVEYFSNKHEVVAISRSCNVKTNKTSVSYKKTDYSYESLITSFQGCDTLIHLAAQRSKKEYGTLLTENINLDNNVFRAAQTCGIKNIIFASSRGVYGELPTPWKERTVCPKSIYALSKLQSELTADFYISKGLKIKTLRLAQVFGLGEFDDSAVTTFIKNAYRQKKIILYVKGINREYIYIKDILSAFESALSHPEVSGVYNLGSGESISLDEMAEKISQAFNLFNNVIIDDNATEKNETSIMDSDLFKETFNWNPIYKFEDAALDVSSILKDCLEAKKYGF